ncbi:MAG: hypothetical protein QOE70_1885 [Chthoniobacter sp.]|jgi:cyanophycinase|nr:hypothetical protein [Chthoniobacter sp.]
MRIPLLLLASAAIALADAKVGPPAGSLLIHGGGRLGRGTIDEFIRLAGGVESNFVIIPTAEPGEDWGERYVAGSFLARMGAKHVSIVHTRDRVVADSAALVDPLTKARGVWIDGGRQWRLADAYLGTRVLEELRGVLARGGVIGGSSAGATIQGSYLVRGAPEGNQIMMAKGHEEGFGFLRNSAIDQHVITRLREEDLLPVIAAHPELLGFGIDEGAAIVVQGDRARVTGGKVAIYDHGFTPGPDGRPYFVLNPGEVLDLITRRAALSDITTLPADLQVPALTQEEAAAGRRVRKTTPGWEQTGVYHALYLPANWTPGGVFPVLVEYPGNGGYRNQFGDTCDGTVDGCHLGYGISGGRDYIWIAMPFVKVEGDRKENATLWWGDAEETAAYCVATVRQVCREFGGDEKAVVLSGFSRGSIACNYIGLRNGTIAPLWRAFICHSHYDGVRKWPYPDSDERSAMARLERLQGRPQFISHEGSTAETRRYLEGTGMRAAFTYVDLPFRNHTDQWALRDCEPRRQVRAWLRSLGLPAP